MKRDFSVRPSREGEKEREPPSFSCQGSPSSQGDRPAAAPRHWTTTSSSSSLRNGGGIENCLIASTDRTSFACAVIDRPGGAAASTPRQRRRRRASDGLDDGWHYHAWGSGCGRRTYTQLIWWMAPLRAKICFFCAARGILNGKVFLLCFVVFTEEFFSIVDDHFGLDRAFRPRGRYKVRHHSVFGQPLRASATYATFFFFFFFFQCGGRLEQVRNDNAKRFFKRRNRRRCAKKKTRVLFKEDFERCYRSS